MIKRVSFLLLCIMSMMNSTVSAPFNIQSRLNTLPVEEDPIIITATATATSTVKVVVSATGPSSMTSTTRTDTCNILALSGGGSFGAVQLGILDDLVTSKKIPDRFDLMTGISAGGLNVGFLSRYDNISSALPLLSKLYSTLNDKDIYKQHYIGIFTKWSIYDTTPLEKTIRNIMKWAPQAANPVKSLIGASNINTQTLDIFQYNTLPIEDKIKVLLATSAIPLVFPPIQYNNTYYVDGSAISNQIITQSTGTLNCSFFNVTYISAGARSLPNEDKKIKSVFEYIDLVVKLILNTFDYQLAEFTTCSFPRGIVNACFPTSRQLQKYNRLTFNKGGELYKLGKAYNKCVQYLLC